MKNRTLLMIPGPIEFEPAVMAAMGEPTTSHLAPAFIEAFGQALQNMRLVFESPIGQPLVLPVTIEHLHQQRRLFSAQQRIIETRRSSHIARHQHMHAANQVEDASHG